ncbi:hypothetical protein TWF506_004677 [Arthrobotrys conoides]|uniref:Myb-like domain-containing protein n=1 Tax=Arthrobotrys conoides TaxID=74498 RepID=A0AAN8N235_9PEZI
MADQLHNEGPAATATPCNPDNENSPGNEIQPTEDLESVSIKQEPAAPKDEEDEVKTTSSDVAKLSSESTKPTRKRGRPSKSSNAEENENKKKKSKTSAKGSTDELKVKIKNEDTKGVTTSEDSVRGRGRKAGAAAGSWTTEQDAYLRQLYQQTNAIKEIYERFEEKFGTGKSPNSLQLRWGKLKRDSLVLSPKEEEILKRAIHTVENNKAAAVLDIYIRKEERASLN